MKRQAEQIWTPTQVRPAILAPVVDLIRDATHATKRLPTLDGGQSPRHPLSPRLIHGPCTP
jgi:hypothetical protein